MAAHVDYEHNGDKGGSPPDSRLQDQSSENITSRSITYEQLAEHFHLPINEVAKKLGICTTVLKKVCRRNGIPRWPHRKLKALDKMIQNLHVAARKKPEDRHRFEAEIHILEQKKKYIIDNPACLALSSPGGLSKQYPSSHLHDGHKTFVRSLDVSPTPMKSSHRDSQSLLARDEFVRSLSAGFQFHNPPVKKEPDRQFQPLFRKRDEDSETLQAASMLLDMLAVPCSEGSSPLSLSPRLHSPLPATNNFPSIRGNPMEGINSRPMGEMLGGNPFDFSRNVYGPPLSRPMGMDPPRTSGMELPRISSVNVSLPRPGSQIYHGGQLSGPPPHPAQYGRRLSLTNNNSMEPDFPRRAMDSHFSFPSGSGEFRHAHSHQDFHPYQMDLSSSGPAMNSSLPSLNRRRGSEPNNAPMPMGFMNSGAGVLQRSASRDQTIHSDNSNSNYGLMMD